MHDLVLTARAPMTEQEPSIVVCDQAIPPSELTRLVAHWFSDMVKYVVDVERGVVASGRSTSAI